jgi:hypothetical protein
MKKPFRDWKRITSILLCEAPMTSEKCRSQSETGKESHPSYSTCILDYVKLQRRQRNEEAIRRLEKNHIHPILPVFWTMRSSNDVREMQKPIRDWTRITSILFYLYSGLCEAPMTSEKWRSHSETGKSLGCVSFDQSPYQKKES